MPLEKWVKLSFLTSCSLCISSQPVSSTVIWRFYWFSGRGGRGERNRRETLHSQDKPFAERKKSLISANWMKAFSLPCLKKRGSCSESETKIKSLQRLESSTLACVSFRALERLNQCRRQLESVGTTFVGPTFSFSPGSCRQSCSFIGKL